MFRGFESVATGRFVMQQLLHRRVPAASSLSALHPVLAAFLPWQKHLFRKTVARARESAGALALLLNEWFPDVSALALL